MSKFRCEYCNFDTEILFNFNRHIKTKKHLSKMSAQNLQTPKEPERNLKEKKEQKEQNEHMPNNEHICSMCNVSFATSGSASRHKKICSERITKTDKLHKNNNGHICPFCHLSFATSGSVSRHKKICSEKITITNKLQKSNDEIQLLKDEINSLKSVIDSAGIIAKTSASAMSYLIQHHNNAPPLKQITNDECKKIKYNTYSNDDFVNELTDYYYDKTLVSHIGDFIVRIYKKDDKDDQSIWNSDTTRLTYIIRKSIDDKRPDWTMDKKGNDTCEYIIDPVIEYIKNCINESYEHLGEENKEDNTTVETVESNLKRMMLMVQILRQIKKNILRDEILKYIAPKFYLQK